MAYFDISSFSLRKMVALLWLLRMNPITLSYLRISWRVASKSMDFRASSASVASLPFIIIVVEVSLRALFLLTMVITFLFDYRFNHDQSAFSGLQRKLRFFGNLDHSFIFEL